MADMYIVTRISTKSVLGTEGPYYSGTPPVQTIIDNNSVNKSIAKADIAVLAVPKEDIDKVFKGAKYNVVWEGDVPKSLDFSPEEALNWIRFSSNKSFITANGTDTATITIEVLKPDKSGVDDKYQASGMEIAMSFPKSGQVIKRVNIVNGTATLTFRTAFEGRYAFPIAARLKNGLKVDAPLTIQAEPTEFEQP